MTAKRVGFMLFDGMDELDFVGPFNVFKYWQGLAPAAVEITTIGATGGEITSGHGLRIVPDKTWDQDPDLDVLIIPGGCSWSIVGDDEKRERVLARLRRQAQAGTLLASVCTGAYLLARAGLLKDRPATTHAGALEHLAELEPTVDVKRDERYVDNGDIVTAAGVSAGIDMALHLVRRLHDEDMARQVRKAIQYDPEPPV